MPSRRSLADDRDREKAVFTGGHAFVWAGAGTGKTTVLTLRGLYLVLRTPFLEGFREQTGSLYLPASRRETLAAARRAVRSVVLITFTRKAAAEMRGRLFSYLDALSVMPEPEFRARFAEEMPLLVTLADRILEQIRSAGFASGKDAFERLQAGARALAELAPELQVSTIHSYATRLLNRNPLEAGLPRNVTFADEDNPALQDLSEELVNRWLDRLVLRDPDLQKALTAALGWMDLEQVRTWLGLIHKHPWIAGELEQWRTSLSEPADPLRIASAFRHIDATIIFRGKSNKIRNAHGQWMELARRSENGDDSGWLDLALPALGEHKTYFGSATYKHAATAATEKGLDPEIRELIEDRPRLRDTVYGHLLRSGLDAVWQAWMKLVDSYSRWSRGAELRELKVVTFDGMVRMAADLLRRSGRVRSRERHGLQALLMDEFQDTDPDQIELVTRLLLTPETDSNEKDNILGFFVGDEKQSIYRFRKVDLAHIHGFRRKWSEGPRKDRVKDLSLQTNFRSNPEIIRYVNSGFEPLFRRVPGVQCEHQDLYPFRDEPALPPRLVDVDPERLGLAAGAGPAKELAADQIVGQILEYVGDDPERYRDILVLLFANEDLEILLPRLTGSGIPAVSTGTRTYFGNPEVLDLINLFIVLHNPDDTVASAGLLRSPLVCVSDEDLEPLFSQADWSRCFRPGKPGESVDLSFLPDRARRKIRAVQSLAARRVTSPLETWLQAVRKFVPWPLYADPDDLEGRFFLRFNALLQNYREAVRSAVEPPLSWLLRQRKRAATAGAWDADLGEDVTVADETVNAVRVMTIHKAKGLEAKFVLVFGWGKTVRRIDTPHPRGTGEVLSTDGMDGGRLERVCGIRKPWGALTVETAGYERAKELDARKASAEAVRLAYVSATRARDRLTLLLPRYGSLKQGTRSLRLCGLLDDEENGLPGPEPLTVVQASAPGKARPPSPSKKRTASSTGDYASQWENLRIDRDRNMATPILFTPTSARKPSPFPSPEPAGREGPEGPETARSDSARIRGILVHRYLEHNVTETAFDPAKLEALARTLATDEPAFPDEAADQAASILEAFYTGDLRDRSGRAYCDRVRSGKVLGREVPFYMTWNNDPWTGVIDLVLQEQDKILAVDYKTGTGLDPAGETTRYGKQRELYTEALRRIFANQHADVDFEIFWLGSIGRC